MLSVRPSSSLGATALHIRKLGLGRSWLVVLKAWALIAATAPVLVIGSAAGQAYRPPRNAYGAPDLNGVWNNNSLTRLQRPAGVTPLVVGRSEVAEAERKLMASYAPAATLANLGGVESEWWDGAHLAQVKGEYRTSWLVDPDDGQLPYSAEGRRRRAVFDKAQVEAFDGPEARPSGAYSPAGERWLP